MLTSFRNDTVKVLYDEQLPFVTVEMEGTVSHESYVDGCQHMLYLLANSERRLNVIFDNRKLKQVSTQSRAWAVRALLPRMYSPELRLAIISSSYLGSQLAIQTMREVGEQMGYRLNQIRTFETYEEGRRFVCEEEQE